MSNSDEFNVNNRKLAHSEFIFFLHGYISARKGKPQSNVNLIPEPFKWAWIKGYNDYNDPEFDMKQ